ncbi:MAG TPA: MnmC family methyltransferase [Candidatus Nanoarchaeia archaeon]|nr:MnmC family methyltransferase [Candidatus Nanoarchaeia archaeon]
MKKIITADNTESFLNQEINETYHSQTGAMEEALRKYAEPCQIKELAKTGSIKILDLFFGLGYNSAMAIQVALEANPGCQIEVIGIENDPEIISKIQEVNPPIGFFQHYKKLSLNRLEFRQGHISVKVILQDVKEAIKKLNENYFDAIFYDPFSPKTSPEMWTTELFTEMYRVMKDSGILATYTCARMARENMAAANLIYDDGPIVGRRGPGTIAKKWVD